MAMQAGVGFSKILVIAGAGYTGTILLQNGKLSDLIGEIQGLVKKWENQGNQSDGETDYAEVFRRLTNEVKALAAGAGQQVTILNGSGQNGNLPSLVVPAAALGAVGYGYMWWKGLSFSDLMYVTKHNMEKAVSELTKKLQHASDIIDQAKKHLTQRIQHLDDKMLKQNELSRSIKEDVSEVQKTITGFHEDLGFLQQTVETLDDRLSILSRKQDFANYGVAYLVDFVHGRAGKLPEVLQQEQPKLAGKSFPGLLSYSGSPNLKGLKDIQEFADTFSVGLEKSVSDVNLPDCMDKLRQQQKPLLRAVSTRC
ncbi:hypothetical protein L6164_020749 [Bauhinia variegata]|uniref:Uncharacterized protein n=1 Tax=Bauhinia variegata TaxID=167791 RepID=A0ACB9MW36_BAUVA|nr:hypothetical protein L6164_020749 [Bauhinia variegata]